MEYLINKEWSMGCGGDRNEGQCPECFGLSPSWVEDEVRRNEKRAEWGDIQCMIYRGPAGHSDDCKLAEALRSIGIKPIYRSEQDTRLPNELWVEIMARQDDILYNTLCGFLGEIE